VNAGREAARATSDAPIATHTKRNTTHHAGVPGKSRETNPASVAGATTAGGAKSGNA
jgi:hypothetical protein